jgi:hypothetical protein
MQIDKDLYIRLLQKEVHVLEHKVLKLQTEKPIEVDTTRMSEQGKRGVETLINTANSKFSRLLAHEDYKDGESKQ